MRLVVRIAGLVLCASTLAGCGAFGDDNADATMPVRVGNAAAAEADVTGNVRQAQLLRSKGDLDGATRILSQLMLIVPDDPRVIGEYGKLLVQQGRTVDAIQFLRRAVELQPGDWMLYSALGVAYDQVNDQQNARVAYERALVLKPNEPAILNNYAMSRMLAGDNVAARSLMARAQASGSTDPRIAQNLALLDARAPLPAAVAPPAPPRALADNRGFPPAETPPRPPVSAPTQLAPVRPANAPTQLGAAAAPPRKVVMQDVPFDPLAGPVHRGKPAKEPKLAKDNKPSRVARADHDKPAKHERAAAPPHETRTASNAPVKPTPAPVKPVKPSKLTADHIPALRMTADAGKP